MQLVKDNRQDILDDCEETSELLLALCPGVNDVFSSFSFHLPRYRLLTWSHHSPILASYQITCCSALRHSLVLGDLGLPCLPPQASRLLP
jgi:hypothetical protein